jgi:hypothetical protein
MNSFGVGQDARLCFTPVNAMQQARATQVMPDEACGKLTAGVLQSGLALGPSPKGLYHHFYAKASNSNTIIRDFGTTPIIGSSQSLDTYVQNMAVPQGQAGTTTDTGGKDLYVTAYGAVGNGTADDTTSEQSALNAVPPGGGAVVFPANYTFLQTQRLIVKANTTLEIDGSLFENIQGQTSPNTGFLCEGSCTFRGSGVLTYNEDGTGQSSAIKVTSGAVAISGITIKSANTSRRLRYAILVAPNSTGISSLSIRDIYCTVVEFCIVRATSTTNIVQQVNVSNNEAYDQTGDFFEWNIGTADGPITVANNTISYIHNNAGSVNEGIGIGVAGSGPYAYPPTHPQQLVEIVGNNLAKMPQGIHCELCNMAKIQGNQVTGISPVYNKGAVGDITAIEVAGSFDATIDDNTLTENTCGSYAGGNCIVAGDGVGASYIPSTENLVVSNNKLMNTSASILTNLAVVAGRAAPQGVISEPTNVVITGNIIRNGGIHETGVNELSITNNDVISPVGKVGLRIVYQGYLTGPTSQFIVNIDHNNIRDLLGNATEATASGGAPSTPQTITLQGLADPNGFRNIILTGGGNNFSITPRLKSGAVVSGYLSPSGRSYSWPGSTFPTGVNFQAGDVIYSSAASTQWLVTASGSLGLSSDTFNVASASTGIICQTADSGLWQGGHQLGQFITLSDGTHTSYGVVGSIYSSGPNGGLCGTRNLHYYMSLIDPASGAALNLGSMANGATITATYPVGYQTIGHQTALTGKIGGSPLAAGGCATGSVAISTAATGHTAFASESNGSFLGGNFTVRATVSGNTATVNVCAIAAGTPPANSYTVVVF